MLLVAASAALGTGGCAGGAVEHDVADLRRDLNTVMATSQRLRSDTEARLAQAERRSREESSDASRQVAAMGPRLDGLARSIERLTSRLDELSGRVDALREETARAARAREPASPSAAPAAPPTPAPPASPPPASPPVAVAPVTPPPAASPSPAPVAPAAPAPVKPPSPARPPAVAAPAPTAPPPGPARGPAGAPTAEERYQAAYLDLSRGRYLLAASGFREFIRQYPDSPLADSAQYGIGEAYFSLAQASVSQRLPEKAAGQWEQAVQEFRKVSVNYPRGAKVPTALYKEALALAELRQTDAAQVRLRYLVENFPRSAEASLAREKLAALSR